MSPGGSGVSIGGVGSLRVPHILFFKTHVSIELVGSKKPDQRRMVQWIDESLATGVAGCSDSHNSALDVP